MTSIVIGMVVILVVALIVIVAFSGEEDEDWTTHRPGRRDPDEGGLDDLLH